MASLQSLIVRASGGARRSGGSCPLGACRHLGLAALAAAVLLPAGLGCTGVSKTKASVVKAFHLEKPQPASQMICFWQRRPQHLPDPTRDGILTPGLVGQVFLLSPEGKSVDVTGDLIIQAVDETPRRSGQPMATPEVWHIDKVALRKLATKDDRFGTCYAVFLPWPANWKDVTNVRMQAKYVNKPNADLPASDVPMMLDFGQTGSEPGGAPSSGAKATSPSEMRGIPDITNALKGQPKGGDKPATQASAPPTTFAQPTFFPPPAAAGTVGAPAEYTAAGPGGSIVTTKVWTSPAPPVATQSPPMVAPLQQADFGQPQAQPTQQPNFNPLPPAPPATPALPPAIPTASANRPWGTQPGPNGGLPPIDLPTSTGSLQPVVIPRQ